MKQYIFGHGFNNTNNNNNNNNNNNIYICFDIHHIHIFCLIVYICGI